MSRSDKLTDPPGDVSSHREELESALQAAREATRKLEAIIEASPLAIIALDPAGIVKSWNPAAERIYGWTEEEVLNHPLPTVPADKRAQMERNHHAAVRGKLFANYETERLRKDGSTVHVSISTAPLLNAEGERAGVVALVADISERKRAEAALASQAGTLHEQAAIIEQAYDAIILRDPDNAITLWNQGAVRMYGFTQEEARGRSPHELLQTETPIPLDEIYVRLRRDGYWEGELKHTRKDGTRIVVESRWATVRNEHGEVTSILEIVRDITKRKYAEETLRVSEIRFRTLVEQSPLSKQILSTDGRTIEVNRAWERLWGLSLAEMSDYNILEDEQLVEKGVMPYIKRAFAGEASAVPEIAYVPDRGEFAGQERWVTARIYPVKDDEGAIREVVLVHEDITERRRAERALRESESRHRALLDAIPDLMFRVGADGVFRDFHAAHSEGLLLTPEEIIGKRLADVLPEQVAARALERLSETLETGELRVFEYEVAPRGESRNYEARFVRSGADEATVIVRDISERKRAEQERQRLATQIEGERRRLKELVANVPGVVWEAWGVPDEASQRMDFVSDYVEQMLGYTVEEWLATPNFWLTIVHPEDRERAAREARAGFDAREGGTSRFRWIRKDGRAIEVEAQSLIICDERGAPVGMRGVTMDISERRHAEEALRQSEERYRAFVGQSSEAIWRFEFREPMPISLSEDEQIEHIYRHGYLAECNDVMARMYGYARAEEMEGTSLEETTPRTPENLDYLRAALRSGYRLIDAESQEVDRHGRAKYFLNNLVGMVEGGMLRRVWGTQRDVTERRQSEEEQKFLSDATTVLASSLDYTATLDAVAHMAARRLADYCLVDLLEDDGTITRAVVAHRDPERAAAWREMQRRFPATDARHTVVKVLHTGEPDVFFEMTDEALARAIPEPEHIEMLKQLEVHSAMTVPLTARGRTVGAVTFIYAESGRRYTERELRLAEEFARRAALAVDNARLYQRAQEANHAKDEFLATLSHELRTPITPIIGWVHLLGGGKITPADFAHGLNVIDKNSQSLARLINDLLDMSAILSGKMRIDHTPVSVGLILQEALETVQTQADKRNIEITLAPCPDAETAYVSGDRTRLVQVFWNLFSNAVKFTPDGGRVRVLCERDAGGVRIHVDDEGVGIAPEFLPHVFDRFRQADMSTTKLYGGLGIGLALVRSFVEAHGGTVKAESAGLGRGSRFTVYLPMDESRNADCGLRIEEHAAQIEEGAVQVEEDAARIGEHATQVEDDTVASSPAQDKLEGDASIPHSAFRNPQSSVPQSNLRVLIVEDVPDTLEMLRLYFTARGYAPTACAAAEEALDIATRAQFDIIVTDIGLPSIDGYELLRRLRQESPHLATVPALALTGYAAETDVETAHNAGFAAHVAKPFDPAALDNAVKRLLARADSVSLETDGD